MFIPIPLRNHFIHFCELDLDGLAVFCTKIQIAPLYIIITDQTVGSYYGDRLVESFQKLQKNAFIHMMVPGESSKSRRTKGQIEDWMISINCNRDSVVIALGGGVVGDMAGFVASTYMRGIKYIQIPTTVLSCADSSIGSKTGINVKRGKNLIGSFYDPLAVIINIPFLKTLPKRHWINGFAEIIKMAVIMDSKLFKFLENNIKNLKSPETIEDYKFVREAIYYSAILKSKIVNGDFLEENKRKILNFGHTIGHAIELNPTGKTQFLHGESIAIGMVYESLISVEMGFLNPHQQRRLQLLIESFKLPSELPFEHNDTEKIIEEIIAKMFIDKKNHSMNNKDRIKMILLAEIGTVMVRNNDYLTEIDTSVIKKILCPSYSFRPYDQLHLQSASNEEFRVVSVPGSKSITNRVLLLSALGAGTCVIENVLVCEDTEVMLRSLKTLGVQFRRESNGKLRVEGVSGKFAKGRHNFFVQNSGTSGRFLLAALAAANEVESELRGDERMSERPIGDLVEALRENGGGVEYIGAKNRFPVRISGGKLRGGLIKIEGSVSSQFVSALLMAAPYANSERTVIKIKNENKTNEITSIQFIKMTIELMRKFGAKIKIVDDYTYIVYKKVYTNPPNFLVETDATSSTYPLATAALTGQKIRLANFPRTELQGDSAFPDLLARMGCHVTKTKDFLELNMPRIHPLKAIESIDMSKMTDSFVTLSVLAAVSEGTTEIFNISNQRVKECNRISAVVRNLRSIGIKCNETKTGLIIKGNPDRSSLSPRIIKCEKDHRLAMAFSILGLIKEGIIIDDKRCVSKTFPFFFAEMEKGMRLQFNENTLKTQKSLEKRREKMVRHDHTMVIIGMRGAGKSTLGRHAAETLKVPFVDLDDVIQKRVKESSLTEFINKNGFKAFREIETRTFIDVMERKNDDWNERIISCGGGIVENAEFCEWLKGRCPLVVFFKRDIREVIDSLANDRHNERALLPEPLLDVWYRRKKLFQKASTYEFQCMGDLATDKSHFTTFCKRVFRLANTSHQLDGKFASKQSFFVSLTLPRYVGRTETIKKAIQNSNAVEIRVDLLDNYSDENILRQVYTLMTCTRLPLIFTIISKGKGGGFPDNPNLYRSFVKFGLRSGCDFVSVEWDGKVDSFAFLADSKPKFTRIISSYHFPNPLRGESYSREDFKTVLGHLAGVSDFTKIVAHSKDRREALGFVAAVQSLRETEYRGKTIIAVDKGSYGVVSRIFNKALSPVTHRLIPSAAPGQLSIRQLINLRRDGNGRKHVFLIGKGISGSLSPKIHNYIYSKLGMDLIYELIDVEDLKDIRKVLQSRKFKAANVTIPFKMDFLDIVTTVSPEAGKIGAINTIVRGKNGEIRGHNTDWLGILNNLLRDETIRRMRRNNSFGKIKSVVLGAGGTARAAVFALKRLGVSNMNIFLHNRTVSKAIALSKAMECNFLGGLDELLLSHSLKEVLVIVVAVPDKAFVELPEKMRNYKDKILVELNYSPAITHVMKQCEGKENGNGKGNIINGLDVLVEQAVKAIEIWTDRVLDVDNDEVIRYVNSDH